MNPKLNIKIWRELRNMSQKTLAKNLNISQGYVSELESNEKSPTIRMLYRIAKELKVCPRLLISCIIECRECNYDEEYLEGGNNEGSNI